MVTCIIWSWAVNVFYGDKEIAHNVTSQGTADYPDPDLHLMRISTKFVCPAGVPLRVVVHVVEPGSPCSVVLICKKVRGRRRRF